MKQLIIALTTSLLLAGLPLCSHAQSELFQKYSDKRGITSVYISKAMIENNSHLFAQDIYIGKISGKLNSVQILSSNEKNAMGELAKDVRDMLKKASYELLMKQKSSQNNSEFYILRKGERVKEFIMFVQSVTRIKVVLLEGDMNMSDIQRVMLFQQDSTNRDSENTIILTPGSHEYEEAKKRIMEALPQINRRSIENSIDLKSLEDSLNRLSKRLKGYQHNLSILAQSE